MIFSFLNKKKSIHINLCQDSEIEAKKLKAENGKHEENVEEEEDAEEEEDIGEEEEDLDGEGEDDLDEEDGGEGEYFFSTIQLKTYYSNKISRTSSVGSSLVRLPLKFVLRTFLGAWAWAFLY